MIAAGCGVGRVQVMVVFCTVSMILAEGKELLLKRDADQRALLANPNREFALANTSIERDLHSGTCMI